MKRTALTVALAGAVSLVAHAALAGPILLRNDYAPNICGLEVSVGDTAPDAPVQQFGGIQQPWEQSFDAGKICYRVSEPPDICGTWSDWRCCEAKDGESLCAIQ
jgi:hypothetical protein